MKALMKAKGTLEIFDNTERLSEGMANFIIDLATEAISLRGRFIIALSGGNTPGKLYSLLALQLFSSQIDWSKTFIFWGDERCVPLTDKNNNAFMAKSLLLDKIKIPSGNIYPIPVNLPPADAANTYEKTLKEFFGEAPPCFDLILLGLGKDGHTASLFPKTAVINEHVRLVKEVCLLDQKTFRITFTAPLINQAQNIAFLISGEEKAKILETVLHSPLKPDIYPAQLVAPAHGNLYWFIDYSASTKLESW